MLVLNHTHRVAKRSTTTEIKNAAMIEVDIGTKITDIRQGKIKANISLMVYH